MNLNIIQKQVEQAVKEVCDAAHLHEGQLFVVGCSSSEVLGEMIGTHTSVDVAKVVYEGIIQVLEPRKIDLAVQCC